MTLTGVYLSPSRAYAVLTCSGKVCERGFAKEILAAGTYRYAAEGVAPLQGLHQSKGYRLDQLLVFVSNALSKSPRSGC